MLPRPTLRKLFREALGTDDDDVVGLQIPNDDRLDWLTQLASDLSSVDRLDATIRDDEYIALRISPSGESRQDSEWFMVYFGPSPLSTGRSDDSGLWIADATYRRRRQAETSAPVKQVDLILRFAELVKAKQEQIRLRKQRNSKLTNLKQRSLKSRLIDLGQTHRFSFCLGENKRDVNLSIRVGGKKAAYHIAFAKGKLDAVLEQIPDLIATLENLRSLGVNFRTNNKAWIHSQSDWIEPEETPQ